MTSISVVVATYNGERWIDEQLRSILSQRVAPFEIVITDDASTDGTLSVVERAKASTIVPMTILRAPSNSGVIANIERGLAAVRGDVIVLADQDDVWRPNKLEAVRTWAEHSSTGGWFSDAEVVDGAGQPTGSSLWEGVGFSPRLQHRWENDPLAVLLKLPVVTGATLAFRFRHLDFLLPLPRAGWHDHSISVLLAATAGVSRNEEQLVAYRVHGENSAGLPASSRRARVQPPLTHRTSLRAQIRHFEEIAARLTTWDANPQTVARVLAKVDLLSRRESMPNRRPRRIVPVLAAAARGDYHRYAQGAASATRDLFWR